MHIITNFYSGKNILNAQGIKNMKSFDVRCFVVTKKKYMYYENNSLLIFVYYDVVKILQKTQMKSLFGKRSSIATVSCKGFNRFELKHF